jgi:hypothetical protein
MNHGDMKAGQARPEKAAQRMAEGGVIVRGENFGRAEIGRHGTHSRHKRVRFRLLPEQAQPMRHKLRGLPVDKAPQHRAGRPIKDRRIAGSDHTVGGNMAIVAVDRNRAGADRSAGSKEASRASSIGHHRSPSLSR